jgi:hypothetical protein
MKRTVHPTVHANYASALSAVVGVLIFVAVGTLLLVASRAATPFISAEPEAGAITAPATGMQDSTASGGSKIIFGPAQSQFVHPGVLLDKSQLDYVKSAQTTEPYASNLARTQISKAADGQVFGSVNYTPHPVTTLDCTVSPSGCTSIKDDAIAAYTLALNYYYSSASDRAKYATSAITIINAWSGALTATNGNQSRLETAFSAGMYAQAAEILRYTYTPATGQPALNLTNLRRMFADVMAPVITAGDPWSNGNWELSMAFSLINMGVYLDDRPMFDRGVALWRARVPAYIYMSSDGANPVDVPGGKYDTQSKEDCFWAGTSNGACTLPSWGGKYYQGMTQETCRDMDHAVLGLNAIAQAAETAHHQGVDLYGEQRARITAALEFTAQYNTQWLNTGTLPTWLCGGRFADLGGGYKLGWEAAYNHYSKRLGQSLPYTLPYITNVVRPSSYKAYSITAWQSLTHPNTP